METKSVRVPFDLELAKRIQNNECEGRIVTRNGRSARIICFDAHCDDNIVALIEDDGGVEHPKCYVSDGMAFLACESDLDLMLEIPEYMTFKDGDVLTLRNQYHFVFVYKSEFGKYGSYFGITLDDYDSFFDSRITSEYDENIIEFREANTDEKQKLIDILKTRKEPKAKEYLKRFFGIEQKQEYEFKPFDKVLVRQCLEDKWEAMIFSNYTDKIHKYRCCGMNYMHCIPYNDQTAHLLGTTEDYNG